MHHCIRLIAILLTLSTTLRLHAQSPLDDKLPVRGFCISAPVPSQLDNFLKFIKEELGPRHVNTLILRVEYNYQFESQPGLRDSIALSKSDVQKLVKVCKA